MSSEGEKKRKKKHAKSYYMCKKKKFSKSLDKDMKGFLFTCNPRCNQKQTVMDSYKILNEFADKLYGPENKEEANFNPEEDFTDQLNKQLEDIKAKESQQRRFQHLDTNVKSYHFIEAQIDDPCLLMDNLLCDIENTGRSRSKSIERMVPVNVTCRTYVKDVAKAILPVLERYFGESVSEKRSYYVIFNKRNNDETETKDIYQSVISLLQEKFPSHPADFKNPDLVIYIQVLCKICCFSILSDYNRFRKYNVREVADAYWKKKRANETAKDEQTVHQTAENSESKPEQRKCEVTCKEEDVLVENENK